MNCAECVVTVRFSDDDVVEWLVDNGEIDEEEADTHIPTYEEKQEYAWEMIERDDGEYGSIKIS